MGLDEVIGNTGILCGDDKNIWREYQDCIFSCAMITSGDRNMPSSSSSPLPSEEEAEKERTRKLVKELWLWLWL